MDERGLYGLQVLPYPEAHWELKHGEPTLDIVAVHGLNGSPTKSWTTQGSSVGDTAGVHWLRDLLFYKVPQIRCMTFGYRADYRANTTAAGIRENAESLLSYFQHERGSESASNRPILWIGHSLGGIIIKEALNICCNEPRYAALCPNSTTVMFMGTPHRACATTSWEEILATISESEVRAGDGHKVLWKTRPQDLEQISTEFLQVAHRFRIVSFFEELNHRSTGSIVVPEGCAVLQIAGEEAVRMTNSDHYSISRFESLDCPRFSSIWRRILMLQRSVAKPSIQLKTIERDCLTSLFLKDAQDIRDVAFAARYPGTNQWLPANKDYCEWKNCSESSVLWILGAPGYGKTVLATTVLDDLDHRDDFEYKNSLLAFFFWDDKDDLQNNVKAMYRTIIWQLLRQKPELFRHVLPEFEIQQQRLFDSLPALARLFKDIALSPSITTLFVVLDALDECNEDDREMLLMQLLGILAMGDSATLPRLKILLTSRDYDGIRGPLSHRPTIILTPEILHHDIALFTRGKVNEIAVARRYPPALKDRVYNIICERANGMFLWVAMILVELKKTPLFGVDKKLQQLPQGLYEIYDSILNTIPIDAVDTARHILQWVVVAVRPLSLQELAFAMGTQYTMLQGEDDVPFAYDIEGDVSLCGPILTIRNGLVNLIHQSAKDFLVKASSHATIYSSLAHLGIDTSQSQTLIAQTCLRYLVVSDIANMTATIKHRYGNEDRLNEHFDTYPFLEYSAAHWLQHAQQCGNKEELLSYLEAFDWPRSDKFDAWFRVFWLSREMYLPHPNNVTPCHIAAHFHLTPYLARHVAATGLNACEPTYYGSLLHAASWAGNLDVVDLLLTRGADVNVVGGRYGTALQAASGNNHVEIVRRLLKHGADVNPAGQSGAHGTALQAASLQGFNKVVAILLAHGANVNADRPDGCFGLALRGAARNGHKSIVQRLLRADADVHAHAQGIDYGTALQKAAESGEERTVELLLTAGMEATSKIKTSKLYDFGTALQAAVSTGQVETARLLIDAKADVNAQGSRNGTALIIAASSGNEDLVQLLIDAGAHVSQISGGYGTPLIAAARGGKVNVLRQLLAAGASPNERGGFYGNALEAAIREGHAEAVNVLLEAGADAKTSQDVYSSSTLRLAREHRRGSVISTILEHVISHEETGGCSAAANPAIASVEELTELLDGNWRGYYYYAVGNRARDEGEVIFTLRTVGVDVEAEAEAEVDACSSKASHNQNQNRCCQHQKHQQHDNTTITTKAKTSDSSSPTSPPTAEETNPQRQNSNDAPTSTAASTTTKALRIQGDGDDKWGSFVIVGTAHLDGSVRFQKDYKAWGWDYSGQLSLTERAMAGRWGRDGEDIHGTFAFYRA